MEYRMKAHWVVYDLKPIDPTNLPKTKLTELHSDGAVVCSCCGVKATHQAAWRHENEPEDVRHCGYLNPIVVEGNTVVLFYMTIDHILPKSFGGANKNPNLRAMCYRCNSARGNKLGNRELVEILANAPNRHVTRKGARKLGIKRNGYHKFVRHPLSEWAAIFARFPELEKKVRFA